jgi:DNA-binding NarL/FixJ family response regulator
MAKEQLRIAVLSKHLKRKTVDPIKGMQFMFPKSFDEAIQATPDVVIIDETDEYDASDSVTKILVVGSPTKENIIHFFNFEGFAGFIPADISSNLLEKAVKAVKHGEMWLSRKIMSLIFADYVKNVKKMSQIWLECLLNLLKSSTADRKLSDIFNMTNLSKLLSKREKEILDLVANGNSNKDIAKALFISEKTVRTHLHNIFKKLDISKRTEAVSLMMDACSTEGLAEILLSFIPFVQIGQKKTTGKANLEDVL